MTETKVSKKDVVTVTATASAKHMKAGKKYTVSKIVAEKLRTKNAVR
jgi:hypothetical protein